MKKKQIASMLARPVTYGDLLKAAQTIPKMLNSLKQGGGKKKKDDDDD